LSSYGWYDKLGVVKIPKSHIHQYREDSHRRVKSKGHAERAIFVLFFSGGPALTIYPAPAFGCLHGENGMVCS